MITQSYLSKFLSKHARLRYLIEVIIIRPTKIPKTIVWLVAASLLVVLFYEVRFKHGIPISDRQTKVFKFFATLAYSTIASFIFYYITIFLPEERRKARLLVFFQNRLALINEDISKLCWAFTQLYGLQADFFSQKSASISKQIENLNPSGKDGPVMAGGIDGYLHWYDFNHAMMTRIGTQVSEVCQYHSVLSPDVLFLLANIEREVDFAGVAELPQRHYGFSSAVGKLWDLYQYRDKLFKEKQKLNHGYWEQHSALFRQVHPK